MTTLAYRADEYVLSEASEGIAEVLFVVAEELPRKGFTDVKNEGHVFCMKGGCLVDLIYLGIDGRTFWQVVAGVGPDRQTIDEVLEEVKQIVASLKFL